MSSDTSFACDSPASSSSTPNPRKRARPSDMTADERKEARAQRNRIAAQCSRDRRKQQFADLETRVAELEEENRKLRAGVVPEPPKVQQKSDHEQEKREKENEELRERHRGKRKRVESASVPCRLAYHPIHQHSRPVGSYRHGFHERVGSPPSTGGVRSELFIERCSVPAAGPLDLVFHAPTELDIPAPTDNTNSTTTTNENVYVDEWLNAVLQPSALEQEASGSPWNTSSAGSIADSDPVMSPLIIDDLNASLESGEVEMEKLLKMLPENAVDLRFDSLAGLEQSAVSPLAEWTWLGENTESVGVF
ncbi:bZIP transcription factor [Ceratobasidium sp. AG-Ba]|nr:bZIP transcription factor [Ceratobasidium sp. AG-Ba]QRW08389.1 bZIP transcription factor [Ceratobasidium sp. AG-Ba]